MEHPERNPYTAHVAIAKTQSRKRYAREAAESSGLDRELVERIVADLCSTRFAEIEAAVEAEEGADGPEDQVLEVSEEEIPTPGSASPRSSRGS